MLFSCALAAGPDIKRIYNVHSLPFYPGRSGASTSRRRGIQPPMSKRLKAVVLTISVAIVLLTISGGLGVSAAPGNDDSYRQLGVYTEVLSRIRSEYVEDPNISAVTNGALHGLLEALDANSSYLSASEYKQYKIRHRETKGNIGGTISKRFGYAAVISVIPGGPADKATLQNGDIVEAIEGKSTREMSLAEVTSMLGGEPGSKLNISVVRPRRPEPATPGVPAVVAAEPVGSVVGVHDARDLRPPRRRHARLPHVPRQPLEIDVIVRGDDPVAHAGPPGALRASAVTCARRLVNDGPDLR